MLPVPPLHRRLAWLCVALTACDADSGRHAAGGAQAIVRDGVKVALAIERTGAGSEDARALRVGDNARVTFTVTDTATGQGIAGLQIGAWLAPRPGEVGDRAPDEATTRNVIRKLVNSTFGSGATNLNTWFLVTLNTDRTLAVIDPTVDFSRTRLRNLVELPACGADLAFGRDGERLYVTMPDCGEVAVVDLAAMTLVDRIRTGRQPQRIVGQPGTGMLWVEDAAGDAVHSIDGGRTQAIAVGEGPKLLAFDADSLCTFVAVRDRGDVVAIDAGATKARSLAHLGGEITGLVFADAAAMLFACLASGKLVAIAPATGAVTAAADLPAGSGPLAMDPKGRWLFAIDRAHDCVRVIDVATRRIVHTLATGRAPARITCTAAFAFVHCAGSRELTLIQLSALADAGSGPCLHIPVLQAEPTEPIATGPGSLLVGTPPGDSVLVAAPGERLIYSYTEGMNAPMGSYQNYSRVPVAIGVIDRSLRPAGAGRYTTTVPLDQYGNVDVYVYLDRPTQLFGRFALRIEPDAQTLERLRRSRPAALPEAEQVLSVLPVGLDAVYRFRLIDCTTQQPIAARSDVRVLVHERFGNWQRRLAATAADDRYEVALRLPRKGAYQLQVQSASLNLDFAGHRPLLLEASDDVEAPLPLPATAAQEGGR